MKQYFFISDFKKQSIFSEFNNICKDVNLSEIDENDVIETLFNVAFDMIHEETEEAIDMAANEGIREEGEIYGQRNEVLKAIVNDYLKNN